MDQVRTFSRGIRSSMSAMLEFRLPLVYCDAFLKGKCALGEKCVAKHRQWEDLVKMGVCPMNVIGQCKPACKFGLEHTR